MSQYERLYLESLVSGDGGKYYFDGNTTIDNMDGWGMPGRRVSSVDVLNRDGWVRHIGGYEGLNVNIDFYMECSTYQNLWNEKDALNQFLNRSRVKIVRKTLGRYMIGTFQQDTWQEKADDEGIRVAGRLSFICHDPFKYSTTETNRVFKGFTHSGENFNKSVYVSGNYQLYPFVYCSGVVGTLTNFSITNLENNSRIAMTKDLLTGKFIWIDNDNQDCLMSGGVSVLDSTSPDSNFVCLQPGANRLFIETSDSNSGQFSVEFNLNYKDRWL